MYQLLADLVLTIHVGVVIFVVGALPLIIVGGWLGWRWTRRWSFRVAHLVAIAVVVVTSVMVSSMVVVLSLVIVVAMGKWEIYIFS